MNTMICNKYIFKKVKCKVFDFTPINIDSTDKTLHLKIQNISGELNFN